MGQVSGVLDGGRRPFFEMPPEEVASIVDVLESAGVRLWIDGGWGVDALLGRGTNAEPRERGRGGEEDQRRPTQRS